MWCMGRMGGGKQNKPCIVLGPYNCCYVARDETGEKVKQGTGGGYRTRPYRDSGLYLSIGCLQAAPTWMNVDLKASRAAVSSVVSCCVSYRVMMWRSAETDGAATRAAYKHPCIQSSHNNVYLSTRLFPYTFNQTVKPYRTSLYLSICLYADQSTLQHPPPRAHSYSDGYMPRPNTRTDGEAGNVGGRLPEGHLHGRRLRVA